MKKYIQRVLYELLLIILVFSLLPMQAYADGTVSPITEKISVTATTASNGPTLSTDGTTVTITRRGGGANSSTCTIKITNASTVKAKISFSYAFSDDKSDWVIVQKHGSLSLEGTAVTSGTHTVTLDAGGYVTMTLLGGGGYVTGTATLSGFSWEEVVEGAVATVTFDGSKGSVSLGGATAETDGEATATVTGGTLSVVATPASGCEFLGWVKEDTHELLPVTNNTINVPQSMDITAVFINKTSDTAWFLVDDAYLSNNLNVAGTLGSKIVLANNGTLPDNEDNPDTEDVVETVYTIPSGVTLLIPFDSANTICTENPTTHDDAYTAPTVYRTLTMAEGANITVNGAISVSGKVSSKYGYNGMPSGPLGFIHMNSGSNITVNSGANLYVWGYIKGSGSVTVNSGGTVHECFQIADYRGGDATSTIVGKADDYGVFPFNQYYLQNVEVPMTLHTGATEKGFGAVTVTLAGTQKMSIPFIGASGSMFVIDSGYIVKDYIEGTGRTEINVYGDMTVTPVSIDLKVALIGSITIDTNKYALPIPNHMTISLESGSINMNQSMAFLPGSELYIKEDTTCTLGSGKNIYVYDWDNWIYNDGANGYAGTSNLPYVKLPYVPGGNGTTGRSKDALVQVDGTVDVSAGSAYVTAGGANIYSTGTGVVTVGSATKTAVYQVITNGTDISSWPEIKIQPAILLNADGTEVDTTEAGTYTYINGVWHTFTEDPMVCDVCGCFKFYANVVLGNNLDMMFAFPKDMQTDWTGCYAEFVRSSADPAKNGTTPEVMANWGEVTIDGVECYTVTYRGFAAKEMCDTITLTVYDKDGKAISISWTDSIQAYALRMLKKATDETDPDKYLRTVIVDMLNYGAACQTHFEYNEENLANATLDDTQKGYATKDDPNVSDISPDESAYWIGSNLITKSNIQFTLAFNGLSEGSSVTYTFTGHKGNKVTKTVAYADIVAADNCIMIPELVVADARCKITVTVKTNTADESWTESIEAYVARKAEDDENGVFMAFMKFADSAYTYLHNK